MTLFPDSLAPPPRPTNADPSMRADQPLRLKCRTCGGSWPETMWKSETCPNCGHGQGLKVPANPAAQVDALRRRVAETGGKL